MCWMSGFTSSCTCAKSHPGICSPLKHSCIQYAQAYLVLRWPLLNESKFPNGEVHLSLAHSHIFGSFTCTIPLAIFLIRWGKLIPKLDKKTPAFLDIFVSVNLNWSSSWESLSDMKRQREFQLSYDRRYLNILDSLKSYKTQCACEDYNAPMFFFFFFFFFFLFFCFILHFYYGGMAHLYSSYLMHDMGKWLFIHMQPAKAQISMRIRAVWPGHSAFVGIYSWLSFLKNCCLKLLLKK